MGPYNYFYAVFANFLRKYDIKDPEFKSIFFVGFTQGLNLFAVLAIFQKMGCISFSSFPTSKYYSLFVAVPLFIILLLYFSKSRRERAQRKYDELSDKSKWMWNIGVFLSVLISFLILPILLSKPAN
jgi:hypothetical protein